MAIAFNYVVAGHRDRASICLRISIVATRKLWGRFMTAVERSQDLVAHNEPLPASLGTQPLRTDVGLDGPGAGLHTRRSKSRRSLSGAFIAFNRRLTRKMTPVHVHESNVFGAYRRIGALLLSRPGVHRVLDVGAGRDWHFPPRYKKWFGIHLIGLDIDPGEMLGNDILDECVGSDACRAIPVERGSIDLVTVSSGIEHFSDNAAFLRNAFAALRPGGILLAQFPGRWAPFAIANRVLPKQLVRRLLDGAMGDASDHLGFQAHYDQTSYTAFTRIARDAGFVPVYHSPGYYSSSYAEFLLPLWLASYAYDMVRFAVGWRDSASYNLFVLRKAGGNDDDALFDLDAWPDLSTVA